MKVPLADLAPQHAETVEQAISAIRGVVSTGRFILGEPVEAFERTIARICGTAHAVGVASGTDALVLALLAYGIGQGDLVLTTPLTFVATAEAIVRVGARPVFCDVEPDTANLSAAALQARILEMNAADRKRLRAVVPVHLFGRGCAMEAILAVANEHRLAVIEDAAQAVGARIAVRGGAACLSFFPSKNLGAWGDGGAIVTDAEAIAARVRRLRAHGKSGDGRFVDVGMNSRLDAVQAAVLEVKAARLEEWTRARIVAANRYEDLLRPLSENVRTPSRGAPGEHVFHQYVLRVRGEVRDNLAAHLGRSGIETRAYYATPLHREPCFADMDRPNVPEAERASREMLAIPMFYGITDAQQAHVVSRITAFFDANG